MELYAVILPINSLLLIGLHIYTKTHTSKPKKVPPKKRPVPHPFTNIN